MPANATFLLRRYHMTSSGQITDAGAEAIARLHRSVARIHRFAVLIWLILGATAFVLISTGSDLSTRAPLISLIAAIIHAVLLSIHIWLAKRALSRRKDISSENS